MFHPPRVANLVDEIAAQTLPDHIVWLDGSDEENRALKERAVHEGVLIPLNPEKMRGCYLHRSNPNDVARVEGCTYICTPTKAEAGPTNNWMDPNEAYQKLTAMLRGSMKGRTMYVIPYVMGPIGSAHARVGVELTDSIYVALSMCTMTRVGERAIELLGDSDDFNMGIHSMLDCDPKRRYICHFPQDNGVYSVGSNYGGNVLLGKKCLALRIGSYMGRQEGWLAEHMLIMGVEDPRGEVTYVAAAFPSACGKTNFAMMLPAQRFEAGWKVWTVGDDIAWMRPGDDGRLWAVNPENGYFGVAPGTGPRTNPVAMATISHDTVFTNVAMTPDGDVWWEGKTDVPPPNLTDWCGQSWTPNSPTPAAHPNSRFTAPATNNPMLSDAWDDPRGVPISAIVFGGRRADTVPLVTQARDWVDGVFFGSMLASETTAAAMGKVGTVRRDPFAMLPFCGYDMGSYFAHWLSMGERLTKRPDVFLVNWFRRGHGGEFLWPGYGDNVRVLKWIVDRVRGRAPDHETDLGFGPRLKDLDLGNVDKSAVSAALRIDHGEWHTELNQIGEFFRALGPTVPAALEQRRLDLLRKFGANHGR